MAKVKGKHVSDKAQYAGYAAQLKRDKNRKARLARHLKNHPNDAQTASAEGTSGTYRSKSHTKGNFPKSKDFVVVNGQKVVLGSVEPQRRKGK